MPMYEYYCRECGTTIEKLRPADARDQPVACPTDVTHRTKRLLSVFAVSTGASSRGESAAPPAGGGGCACGGNCSCRN